MTGRALRPRWARRAVGAVIALFIVAAPAVAASAPASAAALPMGTCTTTSGVVVAVDLAHWGGPLLRSCGSTPTTGYAMLNEGGWQTAGTEHDGPGFICRIGYAGYDGGTMFPTPAEQACVLTPPASAYWAFWQAGPGQDTWSYSQSGAMGADPQPGSVELWMFGSTNLGGTAGSAVPSFSPDTVRALNSDPTGLASTSPASAPTPARTTSRPAQPSRSAAAPQPTAAPDTPADTPAVLVAPPAAATAHVSHGSPLPALVTLIIVVLLAIAGITVALRRPRRER